MRKITYLEGLRGFAALQVVLVHYLLQFLPSDRCSRFWMCWAQSLREVYLFFPVDGYMAVSLFFILSGYVLTKSFARTRGDVFGNVVKRWVRLQIPVFFALALAFIFLLLCGDAYLHAAQLNQSYSWAKDFFTTPPTLPKFFQEAFWYSLIAGYQDISIFAAFGGHFFPGDQSLDVPLWSLNIEFWGSMLIIALAWLRPKALPYNIFLVLCFGIFFMHSLVLFLIGHVLACLEEGKSEPPPFLRKYGNYIGIALIIIGIILDTWREDLIPDNLFGEFDSIFYFMAQSPFHYIGMVAAIFIYLGIYIAPWMHRFFDLPVWQKLGKISFALYLLHFPMLLTVTSFIEVALNPYVGLQAGQVLGFILGFSLTVFVAVLFTKYIDEPAVRFSRFVEASFAGAKNR